MSSQPQAIVLTKAPTVAAIGQMALMHEGIADMVDWVRDRRPDCIPEIKRGSLSRHGDRIMSLFPHKGTEKSGRIVSDNELLVELSGRKCYDSFGEKAGRKTNREYIVNTQRGDIPHGSIMYHAKMSFFIGGVSRRVSHELIRHYVGADRNEEGSPSQESTRYVEHSGRYIAHPRILDNENEISFFAEAMQKNRDEYLRYIDRCNRRYEAEHGKLPKGIERKRIFESASPYLSHAAETSFIWTTNPIALAKLFKERCNEGADLEFQRLANTWKKLALREWPNLFCQPWLQDD